MNVRRTFAYVMLSLLLVLSQQMGISHALSHWSGSGRVTANAGGGERQLRANKSLALDQSCEQCLAFAQIGSALDTAIHAIPAMRAGAVAVIGGPETSCHRRTVCVFHSRAPPVLA
ncbi:hypothetical protein H3H36_01410 [Duganella sp. FT3S]|uniref:DUF2946 domain-containing protein n=2 Tax=Rugamonas fusca TaxID=2758568 RepID=A0A7W2EDM4_9BURK|nr:hypothetical protein [Rugamonas fusca]